ncbi:MAG: FUN14 domain-containing protein [Phycisphaerales bacterium]|jgi:uncharacterized membrane protein (Fun14 family)|nr:FUN14 domain-containing protein [Phycisphaerales bacterium]
MSEVAAAAGAKLSMAQMACAAIAVVVTLAGGGLWAAGIGSGGPRQSEVAHDANAEGNATAPRYMPVPGGATGFVPVPVDQSSPLYAQSVPAEGEAGAASNGAEHAISPAIFRLGFSFIAGFAVAYALRAFVKMTLIVLGAGVLLVAGLQYAGLVSVDWGAIASRWDGVSAWVHDNTRSFLGFLTGQLPSAASGVAGLAMGFRRVKL